MNSMLALTNTFKGESDVLDKKIINFCKTWGESKQLTGKYSFWLLYAEVIGQKNSDLLGSFYSRVDALYIKYFNLYLDALAQREVAEVQCSLIEKKISEGKFGEGELNAFIGNQQLNNLIPKLQRLQKIVFKYEVLYLRLASISEKMRS